MKLDQPTTNLLNAVILFLSLFTASLAAADILTGKTAIVTIAFIKCVASAFQWYLTTTAFGRSPNGEKLPDSVKELPPGVSLADPISKKVAGDKSV